MCHLFAQVKQCNTGIMKMSLRYTSKVDQWLAIEYVACKHGLTIIKIGEIGGITEWTVEIDGDISDISNFANELGTAGAQVTASIPDAK